MSSKQLRCIVLPSSDRFGYYPPVLPFLLPWPRLALLIRDILETQWDPETRPTAKAELARALKLRRQLARPPWWN